MKKFKYEIVMDYVLQKYVNASDVDGVIPSEPVLAKDLKMSRYPINQAVSKLVDKGLLVRVDGIGTYVKGKEPESIILRRQKPHNLLGVISQTGALNPELSRVLSQELTERNFFLGNVFQDEFDTKYEYIVNKVREAKIKGLFLIPGIFFGENSKLSPSLKLANKLMSANIPTVIIERPLQGYTGPRILVDHVGGTSRAVQWMLENGYKKVAYLGKDDYLVGHEKYLGYKLGIEYAGLAYDDSMVALDRNGANFIPGLEEFIENSIKRILSKHPDCRAFMSFNYTFAYCIFRKLCEMKLFKDDMILGGSEKISHYDPVFDQHYLAVEVPYVELGRVAVDTMICQLAQSNPLKEVKRILPELQAPEERSSLIYDKFELL